MGSRQCRYLGRWERQGVQAGGLRWPGLAGVGQSERSGGTPPANTPSRLGLPNEKEKKVVECFKLF